MIDLASTSDSWILHHSGSLYCFSLTLSVPSHSEWAASLSPRNTSRSLLTAIKSLYPTLQKTDISLTNHCYFGQF